jgi:hypothetical protein
MRVAGGWSRCTGGGAVRAFVLSRAARPGWLLLSRARLSQWIAWLPVGHPLRVETQWLRERMARVDWAGDEIRRRGHLLGVRLMLLRGYASVGEITEADLCAVPERVSKGLDALDALLCEHGVLGRTAQRGAQRRLRVGRLAPAELVGRSQIPERFRAAHQLYLEVSAERISDVYATARHKHNSLEHLWCFLDERYPEVGGCEQVRRAHLLAFIPYARARAREVQRRRSHLEAGEDRMTAHQWLVNVRCFFADVCTWALEDGSPFARYAPPAVPLERHGLRGVGFEKARRRQEKRTAATILDLERAIPRLRALEIATGRTPARPPPRSPRAAAPTCGSAARSGTGRCWSCCSSRGSGSKRRAS